MPYLKTQIKTHLIYKNETKKLHFFLLFSLCFVSCGDRTRLDVVYDAAGLNGIELKKAIDHYAEKGEDSLKLKAATFIIENMPGQRNTIVVIILQSF